MKNSIEQPWIDAGYEIFSQQGPDALKIEQIARKVGISKSSFYHHFADIDIFREKLLEFHLHRALLIAEKAKLCKAVEPDLLLMFIEMKQDLLFNRQLRIHRSNMAFQLSFERAHTVVQDEFIGIWAAMLDLKDQPRIAQNILNVATDLFYQRLTNDNLTYDWFVTFIEEIKVFLKDVIKSSGIGSQIK
jgi:AcrR family transcriptional regulator